VSTVASIPAPTAIYREEQLFSWWIYALVGLVLFVSGLYLTNRPGMVAGRPGPLSSVILIGLVCQPLIVVGFLRMTTQITPGVVEVWFGWIPTYRRAINISMVERLEVVTYHPLKDCGGWGIRAGRDGERVLNARGDRGVRLFFRDGTRILIGSQHPEVLASAVQRELRPA
jgi:hypothetical protein